MGRVEITVIPGKDPPTMFVRGERPPEPKPVTREDLLNAFDRMLGTNLGSCAVRALASGETGKMVGLQAGTIVTVPLSEACANIKSVPIDGQLVRTARDIGISFAAPKESKIGEDSLYEVRTNGS